MMLAEHGPVCFVLLALARGKDSLRLLDEVEGGGRLSAMEWYLTQHPGGKNHDISHDHGIVGAQIILKMWDCLYAAHHEEVVYADGHATSFNRVYFDNSIVRAAHAVALHNLDQHKEGTGNNRVCARIWDRRRIWGGQHRWLAFLLKLADLLQVWHKYGEDAEPPVINPEDVEIELLKDSLRVKKLYNTEYVNDVKRR